MMKRLFVLLLAVAITSSVLQAQNVGIGTAVPSARLHIHGRSLMSDGAGTITNTLMLPMTLAARRRSGNIEKIKTK